jgi:hypothetical protein
VVCLLYCYPTPATFVSMKNIEIAPWVASRIVQFFNNVQKPADIVQGVLDDPNDNENEAFRLSLAKRILQVRNAIPGRRFRELAQIDAIPGVGPDKMNDLAFTFNTPASVAFEKALFDQSILLSNWTILRHEWVSETDEEHQNMVNHPEHFRQIVRQLAVRAAMETAGYDEDEAQQKTADLETAFIDTYTNSTAEAAYAFALWFYRFDADNWFSFERMVAQTQTLFDYYSDPFSNHELRLFKGFDNRIFFPLVVSPDLPVTVNDAERTITIWVVGLAD